MLYAAEIAGKTPGKTLIITAGMDGDEYAGIEAAYALIEKYKDGNFAGKLYIVPIVNSAGFKAECSQNPLDGKFPKKIYPGKKNGSPTEQLVHELTERYVAGADAWLDLHGGAITESITPFLGVYETGVEAVDTLVKDFYSSRSEAIFIEKAWRGSRAALLAKENCLYILAESGERGERRAEDIERHVRWAEALMRVLHMLPAEAQQQKNSTPTLLRHIECVYAPYDGIIRPAQVGAMVKKGDVLGTHLQYDRRKEQKIISPKTGTILWHKETMSMRRGDILWAIGY